VCDRGPVDPSATERRRRAAAEVLVEYAPDGTVVWASPSLESTFGWAPSDISGTRFRLSADEDAAEAARTFSDAVSSGESTIRSRLRARSADGSVRWTDTSVHFLRDDAGTLKRVVAVIRDVTADVEAELASREREERLRLVMETSSVGMALATPDGSFLEVNHALADMLGYTPEALVGMAWQQLTHPDDLALDLDNVEAILDGSQDAYRMRKRYLTSTGDVLWGDISVTALRSDDGSVRYLLGQVIDVTDQVVTRERFRLLAENGTEVVATGSNEGIIEWLSPSVEALTGWRPGEMVGTAFRDYVHPDDAPLVAAAQARVLDGVAGRFEARFRTVGGGYRWLSIRVKPVLDEQGQVVGRISGWRDFELEHAIRDELAERELRYRLLAENASDVVFTADADRRVTWVSPAVTALLGWRPDELVGGRMADLGHPDDTASTEAYRRQVYGGELGHSPRGGHVVRMRAKDGTYHWMASKVTVRHAADGTPAGVVAGLTMVDEVVAARERAQEGEARLRAVLDSLMDPHVLMAAVRDADGRVVDFVYETVNEAACQYHRLPREQLEGAHLLARMPAQADHALFDLYVHTVDSGDRVVLDDHPFPNETLGGERRYDIRGVRVGDAVSVTWRDVTDRSRAAQDLASSEEHYRLLAENIADVVGRERDGRIIWISPSVTDALGGAPEEWMGRELADLVHPEDHRTAEWGLGTTAESRMAKVRVRAHDGTYRWISVHTRPFLDADGRPDGTTTTFRVLGPAD
jgi:PAS domain S-box-containing protein